MKGRDKENISCMFITEFYLVTKMNKNHVVCRKMYEIDDYYKPDVDKQTLVFLS